ncbi:chromosome partitioning protein ParA [Janthinobacterium sp. SUN073]|uniref:chromosome partitioning protein ParA n=1 Tax=Janthinobacterium sp. SUN073 TaxID=3004102 RepID=UPI0025B22E0E|nr:chromosome partitioning protein ParA [Janthinobacterium sp. SUN073]MDN2699287.1 chromosome partitioning protein ParA [Janthinobacterium sp. SUN073]
MEQSGTLQEELKLIAHDLGEREAALKRREDDLAKHELAMSVREQAIVTHHQVLEEKKAELARREQAVVAAEQARDADFADERAALQAELRDKRADADRAIAQNREQKLSALEEEITGLRAKRLEDISSAESSERDRIRAGITRERDAWTKAQDDARKLLDAEYAEQGKQKGALSALQGEIQERSAELEQAERLLERKEQRLEQQWQRRSDKLDEELDSRLEQARMSLASQRQSLTEENSRLRESLAVQSGLVGAFEQLKRQLGGKDPAEILRDLNSHTDELKRLREELATRPTEEMRERNHVLELEARKQKARADDLDRQLAGNDVAIAEVGDLRRKNSELNAESKSLAQRASIFEGAANEAQAELNRLRAAYERPAEVEARHKEIEIPHFSADKVVPPAKTAVDEMTWLTGISNACDAYGLHFNTRILKAFHTSLKTAEWSPLTVLAGVSGTGKSELPRLYSHFGGIYFEPLSVQPNWDSQESLLGFFNSIDNKFDAQAVLRFLAQSQKPWSDDYPGLADAVCLILLDEMNLAHPELYFAEFLSKLELRRGRKGDDVPFLPVKIGAGMAPYKLQLGRNVLWAGTMNQDETTKSLSDKVIDRSIIINFPRPTELKRRLNLKPLDDRNRGAALHKKAWQGWLAQGSDFTEEEITPFKTFIEKMNAALAVSGRALGHRVWQSVEYYMANYPDVRSAENPVQRARAMHTAFEDQLVQKVMPKLRGIDTRGKSKTECLDRIRGQIVAGIGGNSFNLSEDFDLACELGYGQFMWQSANYLNDAATEVGAPTAEASVNGHAGHHEEPPSLFQKAEPDQEKRRRAWNAKPSEKRSELRRQLEENERTGRIVANNA